MTGETRRTKGRKKVQDIYIHNYLLASECMQVQCLYGACLLKIAETERKRGS